MIKARIQKHLYNLENNLYRKYIEDSFTTDGGTFEHVHRFVQSNEAIPTRPNNRSLLEIKKEDDELTAMIRTLNEILSKGISRFMPLLQAELKLAMGRLKEIMPKLKRIDPSSYYKLTPLLHQQKFNYANVMVIRSAITSVITSVKWTSVKWKIESRVESSSEKLEYVLFELDQLLSEWTAAFEFAIAQEAIEYLDQIIAHENQSGATRLPAFRVNRLGNQIDNFKRQGITGEVIIDFLESNEATFISYLDLDFIGSSKSRRENSGESLDLPPPGDYAVPNNPAQFALTKESFPLFQGGLHSALVTGIRTDAGGNLTHIEVMQSWGPYVGKMGRHLISYEYIRQFGVELTGLKKLN
jgi:hypothetical protein